MATHPFVGRIHLRRLTCINSLRNLSFSRSNSRRISAYSFTSAFNFSFSISNLLHNSRIASSSRLALSRSAENRSAFRSTSSMRSFNLAIFSFASFNSSSRFVNCRDTCDNFDSTSHKVRLQMNNKSSYQMIDGRCSRFQKLTSVRRPQFPNCDCSLRVAWHLG